VEVLPRCHPGMPASNSEMHGGAGLAGPFLIEQRPFVPTLNTRRMTGKTWVLVVDDEPMVLESVRMTLSFYGYSVETATSGTQALEKLGGASFSLLITDRKMPGMSGEQLALLVKEQYPTLPVVLLTGYPPEQKPEGIDVVLLKPFSTADLKMTVAKLLGQ
jgi:CheY-like chemotaxis protein